VRTQTDKGASVHPRYETRYEKAISPDGSSACLRLITGHDDTSQANADTVALASLNAYRRYAFGTDATNTNKGPKTGQTLDPTKH
jgi:hypothetical protein